MKTTLVLMLLVMLTFSAGFLFGGLWATRPRDE